MKVDSTSGMRGASPARRPERGGGGRGGGFATHLDEPAAAAAPSGISGAGAVAGVGAILSLQEVDDPGAGRRQAVARGETLLDRLDELRHGLLLGTLTHGQLLDLARIVRLRRGAVDDPGLLSVLDDIDLRAQVELAKYEIAARD
jgi:hypothetical protein